MFQRLSNLLFGEVEQVAAELKGPNPCVTEADEEGWMLVNLPGESQKKLMFGVLNAENFLHSLLYVHHTECRNIMGMMG